MSNKWNEITNEDVKEAIRRYDKDPEIYSKFKAKTTFLIFEGREYPAKAIRRIAYQVHFNNNPDENKFSGGEQTIKFFEKLGFETKHNINKEKYPYNEKNFYSNLINDDYFFSNKVIENYLISLKVKPFVILTGNSGTGKTKLAQLFAQYLQKKLNYKYNYELVAVGANWTDNRNIIGFHNVITDEYQHTKTYDLILEANKEENKDKPYFLILDEMNLSYVERYFADFLSALESGEDIALPGTDNSLSIPSNLFVIGTVNIDETTYMFSPKVLDRANVIEFQTVPVDIYMDNNFEQSVNEAFDIEYLENPLLHKSFSEKIDIKDLKGKYSEEIWNELRNHLTKLHEILKKSGFDFGFRVTNEILSFILEAKYYENNENYDWKRYLDAQIMQKLLPKLHGSRNVIEETLQDLEDYCQENEFKCSCEKLHEMNEELETLRYVSFIS